MVVGRKEIFIGRNQALLKAKTEKNDEFYTQYADIKEELQYYSKFFKKKRIYLPCDNPYFSQFFTYFVKHFNQLKLKALVATCYDASFSQLSLFDDYDEDQEVISQDKQAYKAVIYQVRDQTDIDSLARLPNNRLELLEENGDFSTQECVNLMKEADVIVTNPPFSLFRELLHLLVGLQKDFILLGASQAITYSETFQLFQANQLHLGATLYANSLSFEVPKGKPYDQKTGDKFFKKVMIAWYTNFDVRTPVLPLQFTQSYSPENYPKLDHDSKVINIDKLSEIPKDYKGKMAVPITFLRIWKKEEFELLGKVEKAKINGQEKFTRLLIQRTELNKPPKGNY
jgi:hypothetical protein